MTTVRAIGLQVENGGTPPRGRIASVTDIAERPNRTQVLYWPHVHGRPDPLSALHGEALPRARRSELEPLIDELNAVAVGRDDIRVECAGTIAGAWFASPGTAYGHELIAAGPLLVAGPVDRNLLLRWLRIGYERRQGNWLSYGPNDNNFYE